MIEPGDNNTIPDTKVAPDVDETGKLLVSPYHPEFRSTIQDLEKQGRRPFVKPDGSIYLSNPINKDTLYENIDEINKLPTLPETKASNPIANNEDILARIDALGTSSNINSQESPNDASPQVQTAKKSSGHGLDIAYLLPLQEARDKYNASQLGKGSKDPNVARGPHQFLPSTWNYLKEMKLIPNNYSMFNIKHSTEAAGAYLNMLESKFGNDPELALAAYNWGPGKISKLVSEYKKTNTDPDSPNPFYEDLKDSIPDSVKKYVDRVSSLNKEDADNYHKKYSSRK